MTATHKCKVCGALWRRLEPGETPGVDGVRWTLVSEKCGACCDNVPMGEQIEPIAAPTPTDTDKRLTKAREVLANLWVTMSEARGLLSSSEMPREKVAEMLDGALRNLAKPYSQALGDLPLDE